MVEIPSSVKKSNKKIIQSKSCSFRKCLCDIWSSGHTWFWSPFTNTGITCRISSAWHDSSTVNTTIEESYQHNSKKIIMTAEESCKRMLTHHASDCWTIMPATVEQSCQRLLNNHASNCWTIALVSVEQLFQWLLKNRVRNSCRIMPVTVEESYQRLFSNRANNFERIVSVTVEQFI